MLTHHHPLFVAFEGGEGTGKSTQVNLLAEHLRDQGFVVTVTKEPGGSTIGSKIRDLLLHTDVDMDPWAEAYLFAAERAQHVRDVIAPALAAGHIVLCDRYSASSVVYQGIVRGLGADEVSHLSWQGTGGAVPDVTLIFDFDPLEAIRRATASTGADRIEQEGLDFHQRIRDAFIDLATGAVEVSPRLWRDVAVIDASGVIDEVHQRIVGALEPHLDETRLAKKVCSR